MNEKIYGQINRASISNDDFYEAREYLVEFNKENSAVINRALVSAAIVAYSRPFLKNEGPSEDDSQKLVIKLKRCLTNEQVELHKKIIDLRKTVVAHSDYDRKESRPMALPSGNRPQSTKMVDIVEEIDVKKFAEIVNELIRYCGRKILELREKP